MSLPEQKNNLFANMVLEQFFCKERKTTFHVTREILAISSLAVISPFHLPFSDFPHLHRRCYFQVLGYIQDILFILVSTTPSVVLALTYPDEAFLNLRLFSGLSVLSQSDTKRY